MEDDNGLELSLGLGCGAASVKSKGKSGSSSDSRTEEGDRGNKVVDDYKNLLHATAQKQDSSNGSQRSDSVKPQENFFNDLSKANVDGNEDASVNMNNKGLWVSNSNRFAEVEKEKRPEAGDKRKVLFDEINNQKKHAIDVHHSDLHDKKTSHISITTDEGSTAENEDVAESEVEVLTSRMVSHHDDSSKRFIGVGGHSEIPMEVRRFPDSSVVDLQGQNRIHSPFSVQPMNIMNVPPSFSMKESGAVGAPRTSGNPLPGIMQVMSTPNGEQRAGNQSVNPGNFPLMFGYSPVQLPALDKDNPWGLVSQLQQFHPPHVGRGPSNSAMQVVPRHSSETTRYDGRVVELAKGEVKQHVTEEGSSSHIEDDAKGSSVDLRIKESAERLTGEGFSIDISAIKPGIAADLKFGGCGSYPNLPWVSTTAPGPNGKTISGVTYRYSANQIKIVCACHGSHLSPEEFIRHASEENANPGSGNDLATLPSINPAASAQS